jgi:hypothetical protein
MKAYRLLPEPGRAVPQSKRLRSEEGAGLASASGSVRVSVSPR